MKKTDKCPCLHGQLKKVLMIMKLTTFLIFVLTLNVFAESYAQSTKITLSLDKATVKEVIEQIESETEFYFMLKYDDHLMNRYVDIDLDDANIHDVLTQLFDADKYNYQIIDRYIAVTPVEEDAMGVEMNYENIDFHFISLAYGVVKDWFKSRMNLVNDFESALLNKVK